MAEFLLGRMRQDEGIREEGTGYKEQGCSGGVVEVEERLGCVRPCDAETPEFQLVLRGVAPAVAILESGQFVPARFHFEQKRETVARVRIL